MRELKYYDEIQGVSEYLYTTVARFDNEIKINIIKINVINDCVLLIKYSTQNVTSHMMCWVYTPTYIYHLIAINNRHA